MTQQPRLSARAIALVCDARKALFLENAGDELYPNLAVVKVVEAPPNAPSHEQGSDRPGRVWTAGNRSAIDPVDMHRAAEEAFAEEIARELAELHRVKPVPGLLLAAPPRTLAVLREALPRGLREHLVIEVDKDLTKLPVFEIEQHLVAALAERRGVAGAGVRA